MSLPSDNLLQPDAYTVSDEQSRGALRCIDRNVRDLPDRIEVAQSPVRYNLGVDNESAPEALERSEGLATSAQPSDTTGGSAA